MSEQAWLTSRYALQPAPRSSGDRERVEFLFELYQTWDATPVEAVARRPKPRAKKGAARGKEKT